MPVRMVKEWVYCPRLAFLEWIDGEWADSGDTEEGRRVHVRVDAGGGKLPPADETDEKPDFTAATARLPPPLVDSPKCAKCSLAGICLPDEVTFFRRGLAPRPLNPSADTALPLYVQQPGARVSKSGEVLVVEADGTKTEVPLGDVSELVLHGPVSLTCTRRKAVDSWIDICTAICR